MESSFGATYVLLCIVNSIMISVLLVRGKQDERRGFVGVHLVQSAESTRAKVNPRAEEESMVSTRKMWGGGASGAVVLTVAVQLATPGFARAADETPTYTKDVAPIFREKCEACHRPGYIAPMSLQTYAESRPWARSIKNRVETRQMPPWHIDKSVGIQKFQNDRSLTDVESDTIVRWADGGAPRGDPADLPPPAVFADDDVWNFADRFGGPPDLIVRSTPHTMPALAQDHWWKPVVPTGLTEDRWVRAIEIRPSTPEGRRVTHHALARLRQEEDENDSLQFASGIGAGLLMEWAVGKQGERPRVPVLLDIGHRASDGDPSVTVCSVATSSQDHSLVGRKKAPTRFRTGAFRLLQ